MNLFRYSYILVQYCSYATDVLFCKSGTIKASLYVSSVPLGHPVFMVRKSLSTCSLWLTGGLQWFALDRATISVLPGLILRPFPEIKLTICLILQSSKFMIRLQQYKQGCTTYTNHAHTLSYQTHTINNKVEGVKATAAVWSPLTDSMHISLTSPWILQ